ncbi:MAG: hypothetical protein ACRC0G_12180 [Fusobacteriaceae bacterium]
MNEKTSEITTAEKANSILQDLKNKGCYFSYVGSEFKEIGENNSLVIFEFLYKKKSEGEKTFKMPIVFDNKDYSRNFLKVLEELKIFLIFNISGVISERVTKEKEIETTYENKGTITQNQKRLLYDKLKKQNFKILIEDKIKSLSLRSVEELSKEDASSIIDNFPRRQ